MAVSVVDLRENRVRGGLVDVLPREGAVRSSIWSMPRSVAVWSPLTLETVKRAGAAGRVGQDEVPAGGRWQ